MPWRNNKDQDAENEGNQAFNDQCNELNCTNDYHWYTNTDGVRVHDPSGAAAYTDAVILGDAYGLGENLPSTPHPDSGGDSPPTKKWWPWG